MRQDIGATSERPSVANEIVTMAANTAEQAEAVMNYAWERLAPIIMPPPSAPANETLKTEVAMSPLFNELRTNLRKIQDRLDSIDSALRSTEI